MIDRSESCLADAVARADRIRGVDEMKRIFAKCEPEAGGTAGGAETGTEAAR